MGLKSEASQPLITRKLINVIILGPRKIKELQDQRSTTVNRMCYRHSCDGRKSRRCTGDWAARSGNGQRLPLVQCARW